MIIDFSDMVVEVTRVLENTQTIALATSAGDKGTARSMVIVNKSRAYRKVLP